MLKEVVGALGAVLVLGLVAAPTAAAHDGHDHVLVLASTVSGGTTSIEATRVRELGFGVDLVDDDAFASMTRSAFEGYRGIVLGDPTCSGEEPRAAVEAAAAWGAAVDGNVVITGTDPVFHAGQGGEVLTRKSIDVALARPGRTGAYVSLSCSFHGAAPGTRVAMLDGLHPDGFTVKGVGCFNDAYVVASHEALDGLTNSMLSNWFCSVHEAFDRWPDTFDVLAIARGAGREFTAGDGTQGTPYILARGVRVISTITLAPDAATQEVLSTHEVTATVVEDGRPQARRPVTFEVVSGPSAGTTARADTDESGTARFRLASAQLGEDEIRATYLDTAGRTRPSNRVRVTWTPASTALRARPAVLDRRALGVHPVELQATLTRGGAPFAGQPVRFSANGKVVCTGTTDAAGAATCSGVVSAVDLVLDGGYVATYEGAELARASSARGELVG